MMIDDIKHCLKVMIDCELCEECNLYGTTGTGHCEHDCVCGALDIIDKYQEIADIMAADLNDIHPLDRQPYRLSKIHEILLEGRND